MADEVSHDFWKAFRRVVKRAKPDAFILGEEWGDAHPWLKADEHDSVMNYRWRKAVIDFLKGTITAHKFDLVLRRIRDDYPPATLLGMFNLLGSHDTERIKTVLGGDMDKVRQAMVLLLTYPGVPCVYYGDEIGMEGGKEPLSRGPMLHTDKGVDIELNTLYGTFIGIRHDRPSLRSGDYRTLLCDAKTGAFGFARRYKGEETRVYLAGNEPLRLPVHDLTGFSYAETVTREKDAIVIQPHSFLVFGTAVET